MNETSIFYLLTSAGLIFYNFVSADLAKDSSDSWIKSTLGGLPTEILGGVVERNYDLIKDKLKDRFPRLIRDNKKTLYKSIRLSQLNAVQDICNAYRNEIKGAKSESYNLESIKQIEKYLSDEKAKLTRGDFQDINLSEDVIKQIISVEKLPLNASLDVSNALINELPKHAVLPTRLVELLQNNLLEKFEVNFNAELANNDVANVLIKKSLSGIQFSIDELLAGQNNQTEKIEELKQTLIKQTDNLERLGYRILYEGGKCKGIEFIGEKLDEINERTKRIEAKLDGRIFTEPKITHNFPNSNIKIYGRDIEAESLWKTLCGETPESMQRRFALISAPSGFGKSILLEKALREVADIGAIKPKYQSKVQQILLIDCRLKKSLSDIVSEFNNLLGTQESYNTTIDAVDFSRQLVQLPTNKTWLILDNFEQWLDTNYNIINTEVRSFLDALFAFNQNLRGVLLTQSLPNGFNNQLNILSNIGTELYQGLPEDIAIKMLQESNVGGLNAVNEDLLKDFLDKVYRIPQAVSSLIGYLSSREDYTFTEFMNDDEFWEDFDQEEQDLTALERGERHTKALITRQINAQSNEVKLLLQALAFFNREVSRAALEALFESKVKASQHISRLSSHNLVATTKELRGSIYYNLHNYIVEQSRKTLLLFEESYSDLSRYPNKLLSLCVDKNQTNHFEEAINLTECAEIIYRHQNRLGAIASVYLNKGNFYQEQGKLIEARLACDYSINLFNDLIVENTENLDYLKILNFQLSKALINSGNLFRHERDFERAKYEYKSAINILKSSELESENLSKTEVQNELARCFSNLASVIESEDFNQSIQLYDKSIKTRLTLCRENSKNSLFVRDLAIVYNNKGVALQKERKYQFALFQFTKAIDNLLKLETTILEDNLGILAEVYGNVGNIYLFGNKYESAYDFYQKTINLLEQMIGKGIYEVAISLMPAFNNCVIVSIKSKNLKNVALNTFKGFNLIQTSSPHLSNNFKQTIKNDFNTIITQIKQLSKNNQEKVFTFANEIGEKQNKTPFGDILRQYVEQIGE